MHYHCEIIMPPMPEADIHGAVTSVLAPFDENGSDEYERARGFWDFWVIGGRYAGSKALAAFDQTKLDVFHEWLTAEKVTVSGFASGKQELQPASQREKVDAKWNELFPSDQFQPCPLFKHSNDQYSSDDLLPGDVQRLVDVAPAMKCYRVIFCGPRFDAKTSTHTGPLEATFMMTESAWNGCNHMPVQWDRTVPDALRRYRESIENYRTEYRESINPGDDWLVVTVDYHS